MRALLFPGTALLWRRVSGPGFPGRGRRPWYPLHFRWVVSCDHHPCHHALMTVGWMACATLLCLYPFLLASVRGTQLTRLPVVMLRVLLERTLRVVGGHRLLCHASGRGLHHPALVRSGVVMVSVLQGHRPASVLALPALPGSRFVSEQSIHIVTGCAMCHYQCFLFHQVELDPEGYCRMLLRLHVSPGPVLFYVWL